MYYSSNRIGPNNTENDISNENYDIWYSDFDEDKGEWSLAKNLGSIVNTGKQELGPFIAKDGVTLYFASTGHIPNLGEKDFYYTTLTDPEKIFGQSLNQFHILELIQKMMKNLFPSQLLVMLFISLQIETMIMPKVNKISLWHLFRHYQEQLLYVFL